MQELLKKATVRVEKALKKELQYLKKTDMPTMCLQEREVSILLLVDLVCGAMFQFLSPHLAQSIWEREMKEGIEHLLSDGCAVPSTHLLSDGCAVLPTLEDKQDEEEAGSSEVIGCRPIRSGDRKTRKQRRKVKEALEIVSFDPNLCDGLCTW